MTDLEQAKRLLQESLPLLSDANETCLGHDDDLPPRLQEHREKVLSFLNPPSILVKHPDGRWTYHRSLEDAWVAAEQEAEIVLRGI